MKLHLIKTNEGFKCCTDQDQEVRRKLKLGQVYEVTIKVTRNYEFHKKYFSLINLTWEYQNENIQQLYNNNIEAFRKTIEIAAGHFDPIWNIKANEWQQAPKSISFATIDNLEFQTLYDNVKNVIFQLYLNGISEEEFNKILESFE